MNHTLQNTKLAGAVTAMALLCALLLAEPPPVHRPGGQAAPAFLAAVGHAGGRGGVNPARGLDLGAGGYRGDMAGTGPAAEALAIASVAVATSVVDTTVSALLERLGARTGAASQPHDADRPARAARSRSAMAMPYFATASAASRGIGE